MITRALSTVLLAVLATGSLAACAAPGATDQSQPSTTAPLPASGAAPPDAAASAAGYEPLGEAECRALLEAVAETARTEVALADAPLSSLPGAGGTACQLTGTANAASSGAWNGTFERLSALLSENGWTNDQQLIQADGPTGSVTGFRKGDAIAVLSTQLTDDTTRQCPQDQPIAACDLPPEKQNYTITIELATRR